MQTMDYVAIFGMAVAALAAAVSFGMIAKTLFEHRLADRNDPFPNLMSLYRKYQRHTRETTGRVNPLFWFHLGAVGVFVLVGVAYTLARFMFKGGF
jgi:hypothetical protein